MMLRLLIRPLLAVPLPKNLPQTRITYRRPPFSIYARLNSSYRPDITKKWSPETVRYEDIKRRTQEPSEDAYLIDVRELDEIAQGCIPSAVSLPLSDIENSLTLNGDDFLAKFGYKKPERGQEIIFYCRSGKRSATACEIASKRGYHNIKNYEGSWLDWVEKERSRASST